MKYKEKKLKKYLLALLAAGALTTASCSTLQQAALQSEGGDTQATTTTTVPVRKPAVPGEWYMFPNETDPTVLCNGMYSDEPIPCMDILNVFVQGWDGSWSAKWMPEVFYHTENSPTWRDVCLTVDPSQWDFYGYTPEECAEA